MKFVNSRFLSFIFLVYLGSKWAIVLVANTNTVQLKKLHLPLLVLFAIIIKHYFYKLLRNIQKSQEKQ